MILNVELVGLRKYSSQTDYFLKHLEQSSESNILIRRHIPSVNINKCLN